MTDLEKVQAKARKLASQHLLKMLAETKNDMVVVTGALCYALITVIDCQQVLNREEGIQMVTKMMRGMPNMTEMADGKV